MIQYINNDCPIIVLPELSCNYKSLPTDNSNSTSHISIYIYIPVIVIVIIIITILILVTVCVATFYYRKKRSFAISKTNYD